MAVGNAPPLVRLLRVAERIESVYVPDMDHQGMIIRPPSEGDSILLQVTLGCSHNKCAFCGAYQGKRFGIKDRAQVDRDIAFARKHCTRQRRLFLMDGDALILPMPQLEYILERIRTKLPWVTRVSSYANAKSLERKSDAELETLHGLGLKMVYMGLESGDQVTLDRVGKWGTRDEIVRQGQRARQAGLKLNVTVLNGLGGLERSHVHAVETGRALTEMDPEQVAALTLMLIPGTPLHRDWEQGDFMLPGSMGILAELRLMLENINLSKGLFLANHASNYLPIKARLPRDKEKTLALIDSALASKVSIRDEKSRGL